MTKIIMLMLFSVISLSAQATYTYTYDANGNRIKRVSSESCDKLIATAQKNLPEMNG